MSLHYGWYFLGALCSLFNKWAYYMYKGRRRKTSFWKRTLEWFFEASSENCASWAATIAVVWMGGAVYIERLPMPYLNLSVLPLHIAVAFFLGYFMEYLAPNFIKWLVGKFLT